MTNPEAHERVLSTDGELLRQSLRKCHALFDFISPYAYGNTNHAAFRFGLDRHFPDGRTISWSDRKTATGFTVRSFNVQEPAQDLCVIWTNERYGDTDRDTIYALSESALEVLSRRPESRFPSKKGNDLVELHGALRSAVATACAETHRLPEKITLFATLVDDQTVSVAFPDQHYKQHTLSFAQQDQYRALTLRSDKSALAMVHDTEYNGLWALDAEPADAAHATEFLLDGSLRDADHYATDTQQDRMRQAMVYAAQQLAQTTDVM